MIPVLIAGGGPVGLALAAELGWHGIECLLVEQGDGVVTTPKMNEVNTRSMEFCRRWGIADGVLDTPFPADWPKDVVFVTTLDGDELGRVVRPPRSVRASAHSPETTQTCSQHWFDPILRDFAAGFPSVTLRNFCRLENFIQSADGVTARITDTRSGATETITARYLVGCDGAASLVRGGLGVELDGVDLGRAINMFFRAPDLLAQCNKLPGTFFILADRGGVWGNLRVIEPHTGLWRLMVNETGTDTRLDTIDRAAHLRRAVGHDAAVEWVDLNIWRRRGVVATSYAAGRVFLAGDAVHQVSPTGALGMNTGLGDAVDLGWKLAATLQGWGGAGLLASYDAERRPVGQRAVRGATSFHHLQTAFGEGFDGIHGTGEAALAARAAVGEMLVAQLGAEFRTTGLQLGYRYAASLICAADGTAEPADDPETYVPNARPGGRAPHAWLADGRSILDLFGRHFTMLRLGPDAPAATGLDRAAAACGMPWQSVAVPDEAIAALYGRRLVLVRPDGHVAWRGDAVPEHAAGLIDQVRGAG